MSDDDSGLGLHFLAVLARKDIKHSAFAAEAGVGAGRLSRWVNGKEVLPMYRAKSLAATLGMTLSEVAETPLLTPDELEDSRRRRRSGVTAQEKRIRGRLRQHPAPTGADVVHDKAAPGLEVTVVGFARSVLQLRDAEAEKTFRRLILEAVETVEREHEARFPQDAVAQEPARK